MSEHRLVELKDLTDSDHVVSVEFRCARDGCNCYLDTVPIDQLSGDRMIEVFVNRCPRPSCKQHNGFAFENDANDGARARAALIDLLSRPTHSQDTRRNIEFWLQGRHLAIRFKV